MGKFWKMLIAWDGKVLDIVDSIGGRRQNCTLGERGPEVGHSPLKNCGRRHQSIPASHACTLTGRMHDIESFCLVGAHH